MNPREAIILCQPDSMKSCCVCCGLFNYRDISKDILEWRLSNSPCSIADNDSIDDKPQKYQHNIRDVTSHICRYQGFVSVNRPGCTLHPHVRGIDKRNMSLYGSRICQEYLCPAHTILNTRQKKLLISMVKEWYEYSIAILDPDSFIWIINELNIFGGGIIPDDSHYTISPLIVKCLSLHGDYLSRKDRPLFHYSLAEYNQYKFEFTVENNQSEQKDLRRILIDLL